MFFLVIYDVGDLLLVGLVWVIVDIVVCVWLGNLKFDELFGGIFIIINIGS